MIIQDYTLLESIGSGSSGVVYLGIKNDTKYAIKKVDKLSIIEWKRDFNTNTSIPHEIFILKRLNHPNIIKLIDYGEDELYFYYVMEYLSEHETDDTSVSSIGHSSNHSASSNQSTLSASSDLSVATLFEDLNLDNHTSFGNNLNYNLMNKLSKKSSDLFDYIHKKILSEVEIKDIFKQLASAISYLHSLNICHGDIKDENVVIGYSKDSRTCKLIDFGSSFRVGQKVVYRGSLVYMPPELIDEKMNRGPEVDMWSLGILLFVLSFSIHPFKNIEDIRAHRMQSSSIDRSGELTDLINRLLDPCTDRRYTIKEVLMHSFLTLIIPS